MNELRDRDSNPIQSALQAVGLARRPPPTMVLGERAYVRWWERARAAVGLTVLVIALGVAFAASIGIVILGAGFLLEQAIS